MKRAQSWGLWSCLLLAMVVGPVLGQGVVLNSQEGGFTVTLPVGAPLPQPIVNPVPGTNGRMITYSCTLENRFLYTVRVSDPPTNWQWSAAHAKPHLQQSRDAFIRDKHCTLCGPPARTAFSYSL